MKKVFLIFFFLLMAMPAFAKVNIVTAYPYIQDITEKIGKDKVSVSSLAKGEWDPHFIIPKPSLIAKTRNAKLLIINGAQLEIGWLPQIIRQANNPDIQTGSNGLLDLSSKVKLIEIPGSVSRSQGDVHPNGNPHFVLDPLNVPILSKAIADKLGQIDSANSAFYSANNAEFTKQWLKKVDIWGKKLKPIKGVKVIQYHRLYDYFLKRYNLVFVGTIEPLPGIPPTPKHLSELIDLSKKENVKFILQDVYHMPAKSANFLADNTGAKVIVLPQDINAVKEVTDIFSLFDEIVKRITY
jgi:zinc/manganese transport system substrate-binding protein